MVTTISMIAVSRSSRIDQDDDSVPLSIYFRISICWVTPSKLRNTIQLRIQDRNSAPVVSHIAAVSPMIFQPKPAMIAATSGAKRMMVSMIS